MADISIMAEEARISLAMSDQCGCGDHANIIWPLLCGLAWQSIT